MIAIASPSALETDVYDREIAFLTEHPHQIAIHWINQSPLFQMACHPELMLGQHRFGCLSMIRDDDYMEVNPYVAQTKELTREIKEDYRIPTSSSDITVEHLPIFAEWQRRLDRELNRVPPVLVCGPSNTYKSWEDTVGKWLHDLHTLLGIVVEMVLVKDLVPKKSSKTK